MTIFVTDWRGRMSPLDILVNVDGEDQPVPFLYGTTTPVYIDMAALLLSGESITNVVVTVRRLPATGETDYTDAANTLVGAPDVNGTVVAQRLQNLERGRVYRVEMLLGAADNRRGASILVQCTE